MKEDSELEKLRREVVQLRQEADRLEKMVEASQVALLFHRQGRVVDVNPAFTRIFGYSREEALGMDVTLLAAPEYRELVAEAVRSGREQPYEAQGLRRDGSHFWGRVRGHNLVWGGEKYRVTSVEDISEQHQALEAQRESEENFRLLAEKSPNMIFINSGGRVVYANELCEQLLGYSRAEILDEEFDFHRLIAPESREVVAKAWERHARGEEVEPYEYTLLTKDGRRLDVINSTRLITFQGHPAILGIVTDISELKQAERSLRQSEERYRLLVETCPDAIVMTDMETNIIMANQQAATLLGMDSPDELTALGRPAIELLSESERERARRHLGEVTRKGLVRGFAYEVAAGRRHIQVETSAALLRDDDGRPSGFIVVIRDVSERHQAAQERRRMERQIQQAQKLESLGILAGGIAHDFNNLLMGVLGNASLALADTPEESPLRRILENIEKAAMRAAELTNQLLAYSGKGRFLVQPVNLSAIVEEMAELLKVSIAKNVTLRFDLSPEQPVVEADASQLRQVVMNLITNASDAIGEKQGLITIYTGIVEVDRRYLASTYLDDDLPEGRYAVLEVSDTGCGMNPETQARIFDPFFTTKFTGRGLGLAAVLGIVRGHQGTVKVYSEPGRGSTIKVLLPLSTRADSVTTATPPEDTGRHYDLSGITVLVVDDEEEVREVTRTMLETAGVRVLTAGDGEEAVAIYSSDPDAIDVVILDTTMPRLGGKETFRRLRQANPAIKVILTSGYNEQEVTSYFAGKKLAGFLQKPYRLQQLLAKVAEVLDLQGSKQP